MPLKQDMMSFLDLYGWTWIFMDFNGFSWIREKVCRANASDGVLKQDMMICGDSRGFFWSYMDFDGFSWFFMDLRESLPG